MSNHKINLTESDSKAYRSDPIRRNGFQRAAEQQANSRQCDVYLIASDGKTLFRARPSIQSGMFEVVGPKAARAF